VKSPAFVPARKKRQTIGYTGVHGNTEPSRERRYCQGPQAVFEVLVIVAQDVRPNVTNSGDTNHGRASPTGIE